MITPSQIREKNLSTVQNGGYDKDEVNELLADVVESYEAVYNENKELYRKMEILANKIEEYRSEEDSIKTALITAQKMADRITKEAKEKAEEKLTESAATAQQTVMDAKEKADKMISEARTYVSDFTKEKQTAAESIINEAEGKANEAIDGAKLVAQNILNQAKQLSDELVTKAKAEKEYHETLVSKLKSESDGFKNSLMSLYQTQMEHLREMVELKPEVEEDNEKIKAVESEMNQIISDIDEINKLQSQPAAEESAAQDEKTEADEDNTSSDETVDEIIDEIEEAEATRETVSKDEVDSALNAFSTDEITPLDENATYISEIDEEPEMEKVEPAEDSLFEQEGEAMPFENYFNVKKEDVRTDETISLIPPEEEDEEEDSSRFKGFFKKKK